MDIRMMSATEQIVLQKSQIAGRQFFRSPENFDQMCKKTFATQSSRKRNSHRVHINPLQGFIDGGMAQMLPQV